MIERKVTISSDFESRLAALFVQTAGRFDSSIQVKLDNKIANAKSIMGIIALGLSGGDEVILSINGEDENEAINALEEFANVAKVI